MISGKQGHGKQRHVINQCPLTPVLRLNENRAVCVRDEGGLRDLMHIPNYFEKGQHYLRNFNYKIMILYHPVVAKERKYVRNQ